MSAAITYEQNDVANVRSSFVAREEATLLAAARAGDSGAFESLVMPHWDALLRVTKRILRNREDAEDAVQTAFFHAFQNLTGFQGRSQFSSWLTRIAMNAALMRLRVSRRQRETSLGEAAETGKAEARFHLVETRTNPEQEYLSKEGRVLLEKGLKKLRPLYMEVVRLRSMQELSIREVAGTLELPVGTVKARLHRGRVELTRHVQLMLQRKRWRANVSN